MPDVISMNEAEANVANGSVTQPDLIAFINGYALGRLNKADLVRAFEVAGAKRSTDAVVKYLSDYHGTAVADAAQKIASFNRAFGEAKARGKTAMVVLEAPPSNMTAAEQVLYAGYSNGMAPLTAATLAKLTSALRHEIKRSDLLSDLLSAVAMAKKSKSATVYSATVANRNVTEFFRTALGAAYEAQLLPDGQIRYTNTGRDVSDFMTVFYETGVMSSNDAVRALGLYIDHNGLKRGEDKSVITVDDRMQQYFSAGIDEAVKNARNLLRKYGINEQDYTLEELEARLGSRAKASTAKYALETVLTNGGVIAFSALRTLLSSGMPTQQELTQSQKDMIEEVYPNKSPDSQVGRMSQVINATADAHKAEKAMKAKRNRA